MKRQKEMEEEKKKQMDEKNKKKDERWEVELRAWGFSDCGEREMMFVSKAVLGARLLKFGDFVGQLSDRYVRHLQV